MKKIDRFEGEYDFLSNYYYSPIFYDGILYPTVEHAFHAAKTPNIELKHKIAAQPTPGKAKQLGRRLALRENWDDIRYAIMKHLVVLKFSTYPELYDKLLATGNAELIEGNDWNDKYWGVCNGIGENNLGKILMEVRGLL